MPKRRGRRTSGVLPRAARGIWRGGVWLIRHPQPVIAVAVVVAGGLGLWGFVTRSEAFRITAVQLPEASSLEIPPSVIGQNLWTVDVRALAQQLKAQQPQLKRVRVIRRPPNTLQIEVLERTPVAQVKLGTWSHYLPPAAKRHPRLRAEGSPSATRQVVGWYVVSSDGFVLPGPSATPWEQLPILKGVESPKAALKVGREQTNDRLHRALQLIATLRRSGALRGHRLTSVDVGQATQLSFVLDGTMEIRCGSQDELATQLERLRIVLQRVATQQMSVRYIDVRFTDPVVGTATSRG